MKIIRNETGRFESVPELKDFDIKAISSEDYTALVVALNHAIEVFENNEWTKTEDRLGETFHRMKRLHEKMTDYKNHDRTFNNKKVKPYSESSKDVT